MKLTLGMNLFKKVPSILIMLIFVILFCTQERPIRWVGCDVTKKAFMEPLAKEYEKRYGKKIIIEGSGASCGIREVSNGLADLGGSSRYKFDIPEEENAVLVPIAWDALVFIVNPLNPVDSISINQAKKIFTGKITNWTEIGGNDKIIDVCVREGRISGVGRTGRQLIFHNPEQDYTEQAKVFHNSETLETEIEKNPYAIGITGISSAKKCTVKILVINGIAPTKANIISNTYPFCRPLFLVYHKDYYERLIHFIQFAWGPIGQEVISQAGTVNLEEGIALKQVYEMEMEGLETFPPPK